MLGSSGPPENEGRRCMSNRFIGARQTTLAREIQLTGTGVHSGAPVSLTLHPAEADTGLRFLVTKRGRVISEIAAHVANVKNLTLCTVIGDEAGTTVGTVEHLLAALRGLHGIPYVRQNVLQILAGVEVVIHHQDRGRFSAHDFRGQKLEKIEETGRAPDPLTYCKLFYANFPEDSCPGKRIVNIAP